MGYKLLIIVLCHNFFNRFTLCILTKSDLSRQLIHVLRENSVDYFMKIKKISMGKLNTFGPNSYSGKIDWKMQNLIHFVFKINTF